MSLRKRLYRAIDDVLNHGLTPEIRERLEELRQECVAQYVEQDDPDEETNNDPA